jgi:hypothetical protein
VPDFFTIYQGQAAPVDASEGKFKRLLNVAGDDLFYLTHPGDDPTSDASLKNGESTELTDRVWLVTPGETKVLVETVIKGS